MFQQNTDNKHKALWEVEKKSSRLSELWDSKRNGYVTRVPGGIHCHIYPRPGARGARNRKCQQVQVKLAGARRKAIVS